MKVSRIISLENASLTSDDVKRIKDKLLKDAVDVISLRNCNVTDKDYKLIMKTLSANRIVRHLSLNIDQITDKFRVQLLAQALQKNISLAGLHLHGNPITDDHMATLNQPLYRHPRLVCLDLSDCHIGDEGVAIIANMMRDKTDRHGLHELLLSHNTRITAEGWRRLAMALAAGSSLRTLHIDYNVIGDVSAGCLVTALPGATRLETLDMECTGITDVTGQILMHLLKSFKLNLKTINLKNNNIPKTTKAEIKLRLNEFADQELINLFSNELGSEDSRSLATSEPPLENVTASEFHDYANMSRPQSANILYNGEDEKHVAGVVKDKTGAGVQLVMSGKHDLHEAGVIRNLQENDDKGFDSKSIVEITHNNEPTLDIKKTRSMENIDKFGKDCKEHDDYFPNVENTTDVGDYTGNLVKSVEQAIDTINLRAYEPDPDDRKLCGNERSSTSNDGDIKSDTGRRFSMVNIVTHAKDRQNTTDTKDKGKQLHCKTIETTNAFELTNETERTQVTASEKAIETENVTTTQAIEYKQNPVVPTRPASAELVKPTTEKQCSKLPPLQKPIASRRKRNKKSGSTGVDLASAIRNRQAPPRNEPTGGDTADKNDMQLEEF